MITLKQYNFCRKIGLPPIPHVERYFGLLDIFKRKPKNQPEENFYKVNKNDFIKDGMLIRDLRKNTNTNIDIYNIDYKSMLIDITKKLESLCKNKRTNFYQIQTHPHHEEGKIIDLTDEGIRVICDVSVDEGVSGYAEVIGYFDYNGKKLKVTTTSHIDAD